MPVGVTAAVVVVLFAVGHHHSAPRARTGASIAASSARRQLVRTLAPLREPQTADDRHALINAATGGQLPAFLRRPPRVCRSPYARHIPGCGVVLDRGLVRAINVPETRYRVAVFPAGESAANASAPRGAFGLLVSIKGPGIGDSTSSATSSSLGLPASSGSLTTTAAFESHGTVVSFNVAGRHHGPTGTTRAAILVPDGVAQLALQNITLHDPRSGAPIAQLPEQKVSVRRNVALITFADLTEQHLNLPHRLSGQDGGFQSGHGCKIQTTLYTAPTTAEMQWRDDDGSTRRASLRFYTYINAVPMKNAVFHLPGCQPGTRAS